jgi:hypothetical protein
MKSIRVFFLASILCAAFTAGCAYNTRPATYAQSALPVKYLDSPEVKIQSVAPLDQIKPPYALFLAPIEVAENLRTVPHAEQYAESLLQNLYSQLLVTERKSFILSLDLAKESTYLGRARAYELRSRITQLQRGSGWLRYFVGFGVGDVFVQWEGELIDIATNQPVCSFAAAEKSNGNTTWAGTPASSPPATPSTGASRA